MQPKLRRIAAPRVRTFIALGILTLLLVGMTHVVMGVSSFIRTTGMTPATLFRLVFDTGADLAPINGRVNVVLLGIGGGIHDGADLTDTILILSFDEARHTLGMISVPRDIWSDTLQDKVNSAYHYGEIKKKGGGLVLSKAIISDMVGLPIQYGIVFDFTKFTTIINLVGGISVDVPTAFTDTQYPIAGKENDTCNGDPTYSCRYETIHFDTGVQVMNGERALQYVRSRHAEGAEGNDFSRGRRQQEVIVALKDKLMSWDVWRRVSRVQALYRAFDDATDTDMNISELATVGKLFMRVPQSHITRISIEDELYSPPENWYGRYVLLPKENFEAIHEFVRNALR